MSMLHKLLLTLIAFPTLFAFIYDANRYLYDMNSGFKLRAAGFFWVNLSPDSYKLASENIAPVIWQNISKILIFPGVYVFGIIALLLYIIIAIIHKNLDSSDEMQQQNSRLDFLRHDRSAKDYKYKRRR